MVNNAPELLNTLNEISNAFANDPTSATTISSALNLKADKSTTSTKTEINNSLNLKSDKNYVDTQ